MATTSLSIVVDGEFLVGSQSDLGDVWCTGAGVGSDSKKGVHSQTLVVIDLLWQGADRDSQKVAHRVRDFSGDWHAGQGVGMDSQRQFHSNYDVQKREVYMTSQNQAYSHTWVVIADGYVKCREVDKEYLQNLAYSRMIASILWGLKVFLPSVLMLYTLFPITFVSHAVYSGTSPQTVLMTRKACVFLWNSNTLGLSSLFPCWCWEPNHFSKLSWNNHPLKNQEW